MIKKFTFYLFPQKVRLILIATIFSPLIANAQIYVDAAGMGGIYDDKASAMEMDIDKNVYLAGAFTDSVDFDPSPNLAYLTTVAAPNGFLAKYDASGNYLWSLSIEGPQPIEIRDIALANSGHVYVLGDLMGTANFDANTSFTAMGVFDVFIAKYDTSGNLIWAKVFGGPAPDWGYSLALDTNENIIATGTFTAFADFDASSASFQINSIGGSPDVFLVKYDSAGNFVWAKNAGGNSIDEGHSVETDEAGNIYLSGWHLSGTSSFDGNSISSNGGRDIFIAKYDNSGNGIWAKGMGSNMDDEGSAILLNGTNLYLSGSYQSTVQFDPMQSSSMHTSKGMDDAFLAKFDTAGNYIWSTSIGGAMEDGSTDMGLDIEENIYLNGFFSSTAEYSTGFSNINTFSQGAMDIFVAKYDSNGSVISVMPLGGIGDDVSNAFSIDDEHFYISGYFTDAVDFNPSPVASNMLTSPAGESIFKSKYSYCTGNYETVYDTICAGDNYIVDPNNSFNSTGSYRVYFNSTSNVCDSILNLHLQVNTFNLGINQNSNQLISNEAHASYQWLDCNADTIISGADSVHFTASISGSYAVILSKNNCVDTSACVNVTMVGIEENGSGENFLIYPNPNKGQFTIYSPLEENYNIYNIVGEKVGSGHLVKGYNLKVLQVENGIYFIATESSKSNFKIVVK